MSSAINSNKELFTRLQTTTTPQMSAMSGVKLMPALEKDEVIIYNDPKAVEEKEKRKLSKKLIIGSVGLTGLLGLSTILYSTVRGKKIHLDEKSADGLKKAWNKFVSTLDCVGSNFSNVKDDGLRKLVDKTEGTPLGFTKKFFDWCTTKYQGFTKTGQRGNYNNLKKQYEKLAKEGKLPAGFEFPDYDKWFDSTSNRITQILTGNKNDTILNDLFKDGWKTNPLTLGKRLVTEIPANDKLAKAGLYDDAIINMKMFEGSSDEAKAFADSLSKFQRGIVDRLRDTNMGNAIGDIGMMGVSLGGLGTALALESNKEERKSIAIDLGIPVVTTVATILVTTMMGMAGPVGLIGGLVLGEGLTRVAKFSINAFRNRNNLDVQMKNEEQNKNIKLEA